MTLASLALALSLLAPPAPLTTTKQGIVSKLPILAPRFVASESITAPTLAVTDAITAPSFTSTSPTGTAFTATSDAYQAPAAVNVAGPRGGFSVGDFGGDTLELRCTGIGDCELGLYPDAGNTAYAMLKVATSGWSVLKLRNDVAGLNVVAPAGDSTTYIAPFAGGKVAIGPEGAASGISASYRATREVDAASIAAGACAPSFSVTVPGVAWNDPAGPAECIVGSPGALPLNFQATCHVNGVNSVALYICNHGGSALDPPNATYSVRVFNP